MGANAGVSRRQRAARRWGGSLLARSLALALLAPLGLATPPAQAQPSGLGRPDVPEPKSTKVKAADPGALKARARVAKDVAVNAQQVRRADAERSATAWPKAGSAHLSLAEGRTAKAAPAGVPVTVKPRKGKSTQAAGTGARVTVLDQKAARRAGVTGVLLTAAATDPGRAEVAVDYSGFAATIGGGWSQRLRLVRLPACALTTPDKADCRKQSSVASSNDLMRQTVSAAVELPATNEGHTPQLARAASAGQATVLAVTAAGPGAGQSPKGSGDYSATDLSASSSWQAGGNSGSFTWSYDFTVPPAAAGPAPRLGLSYDSGSIDGRTANTNNQGTPVGEGFGLTESYIERTYDNCDDDGHKDVYDRCWTYDNARIVLNGKSSRLVKVNDKTWRLESDDASKVTRSTGADNGDDDGEHWKVVTGDGTTYAFGLNKLEGAGSRRTNSTWTVPVFGDDAGEPGYTGGSSFKDRSLTQAWRWNLDYVEDTSGNAATYWYTKETNHYKKNKSETANASYTRGGYLKEIAYGLRAGALFTDSADAKVTFDHAERCTASNCGELTEDTSDNWPDVPFDAICTSGDEDCDSAAPAFFTRKRLTGVNTFSWNATTSKHDPVDSWALEQEYRDGGDLDDDVTDHVLTLKSIKRTGKSESPSITLQPVSFTYQMRPNRVDGKTDDILPLTRPRISTITSETGAITEVTLSPTECVRSQVIDAPQDSNTRSCYPQFWNINGAENASVDWFHKYRVLAVTVSDPAGDGETMEHAYEYSGAAWHHSDDPFTPKEERTWSDWRGYRQVTAYTGALDRTRSKSVSLYFQGMDGDKQSNGTKRSVPLPPLQSPALGVATVDDTDQYAGQLRQSVTYDGAKPISAVVNEPWSKETARQTGIPESIDHVARFVRTRLTTSYTHLTIPDSWRARTVVTTFDDHGMGRTVEDRGDDAKTGDETCRTTWYARNGDKGLTSLVSRDRLVSRPCSVTDAQLVLPADSKQRGDVLSDVATAYDGLAWSPTMVPTAGRVTWTGRAQGYPASGVSWQKLSTATYDALGRPLVVTDPGGQATETAYTPVDAGPLTKTIVTDAMKYRSAVFLDPKRGLPVRSYDINQKLTEAAYDALGRTTGVWLPNRVRSSQGPNHKFSYHLSRTVASAVATSTLKADGETYNTSYALYDSLLRPLQTQSPSPRGGRLLTDTRYDTRGLAHETHADIYESGKAPNSTYSRVEYGAAPTQTETVFDGAGRATTSTLLVGGVRKWSTTTTYTGDSTATTAVDGGSAARTITDARGRTTETREYAGTKPLDTQYGAATGTGTPYTSVRFGYTLDDKQTSITAPDDTKWTYTYDLFGRQATATDPDKGKATTAFDALDRPVKTTDARNRSVLTEYDALGRRTGTWSGSRTDATQLTAYTYDTLLKGQPTASTRYVGGKAGKAYTKAVTAFDSMSRPVATELRLPSDDPLVQSGAPSVLKYSTHYNVDGTLQNSREPALGGLPAEAIEFDHNDLGLVTSIGGGTGYLLDTVYSELGQPQQLVMGTGSTDAHKRTYVTNTFEAGTGRLTRSNVTDMTRPYMLQSLNYTYDQAGNVTSISDPTTLGGTGSAETQCFAYDGHRRMTEAWTPASQKCSDPRSAASLSGPAPYWTSYTYNKAGQRTTETQNKTTGKTTTTYCYGAGQPHTLTATSTQASANCSTTVPTYAYDATGNTTKRPGKSASQALAWSDEGRLSKLTEGTASTDYIYDADGTLLIRHAKNGERVLYAGATELHRRANGTLWAQRHYGSGDQTVAVRSNESGTVKLMYLAGDHHGTQSLAVDAGSAQTFSKRWMTPFGADRGTPAGGSWPSDKGFLGKTADKGTGLTHIGARQYDPAIGQFISVDPILMPERPQSLNGYAYASQSPVTFSDPTGLCDDPGNGRCQPGSNSGRPDIGYGDNYNGNSTSTAGDGGGSGTGSGTATTSGGDPLPSPSPGPPPTPGPYKETGIPGIPTPLKWFWNEVLGMGPPDMHLMCNMDGTCDYLPYNENVVGWGPSGPSRVIAGAGRASSSFSFASLLEGMKVTMKAFPFKKKTQGMGISPDGRIYLVNSGNKAIDDELWKISNKRLRDAGILKGAANSGAASDVEQKFVAIMIRDGIRKGEIVINNPKGPCRAPMGCDQVLNTMLGKRQLTVHWPDGKGGFRSHTYGNGSVGIGGR
ncbi:RHS repeat-associated core domain-containing protein [Streptomyces sp. NPDC005805]|uniref:RHS repeat-associated core domain-containing protein n=1 Tax=Streptomyces sp. NPDC005805 TaxID=3157068 RepID=UPI0033FF6944